MTVDRPAPAQLSQTRILIVDDEQTFAAVLASYFIREGYVVAVAHDGPSAVKTAGQHRPDLVVLEL